MSPTPPSGWPPKSPQPKTPRRASTWISSSFTERDDPTLDPADIHSTQVSAGYSFDFGLDVDLGYNFVQENSVDSHTVGVLFHYNIGVSVP